MKYVENIIDVVDPDSEQLPSKQKKFWNYIKSLKKDKFWVSPLKDKGRLNSETIEKANILNKQYSSVFTRECDSDILNSRG